MIIKFVTLYKELPDGMSLTERTLPWVSVGAASQEVPLVDKETVLQGDSVHSSWKQALLLLLDLAFSSWSPWPPLIPSILLIAWVMPGEGLNAANQCDLKAPPTIISEHYHRFVS